MEFLPHSFFGGAIKGVIPSGWIDASDIRDIPDHQEIFLSGITLSNLIFEINERVTQEDIRNSATASRAAADSAGISEQPINASAPISSSSDSGGVSIEDNEDVAAAIYHLRDLCDPGDSMEIIQPPHLVEASALSSSSFLSLTSSSQQQQSSPLVASYAGEVLYKTPNPKWRNGGSFPPPDTTRIGFDFGSSSRLAVYSCYFLLVRLRQQNTDLVVLINIPHDEFEGNGDTEGLARERELAGGFLNAFVQTLEIQDWDLFG